MVHIIAHRTMSPVVADEAGGTGHFGPEIVVLQSSDEPFGDLAFGPATGIIDGRVLVAGTGRPGVTVRLLDATGMIVTGVASTSTDGSGGYLIGQIPVGDYQVMVVEPLGYASDQNPKPVTVTAGATATGDFSLTQLVAVDNARSRAYWQDQFDEAIKGKDKKHDESPANLTNYIQTVQDRFTPHFNFFAGATTFSAWQDILRKGGHGKRDDATAELAAFLMNLVSFKVGQYTMITEDNRTAGDVLTYASGIIAIANATEKDLEQVRKVLEDANKAGKIKSGMVPVGTILYKMGTGDITWGFGTPTSYTLYNNYPNPFNPTTTIRYGLPHRSHVTLTVFNTLGQQVAQLVNSDIDAGYHEVQFNATNLASGVYFYKIQAGGYVETKRLLLLR